jgi:benzoate transport
MSPADPRVIVAQSPMTRRQWIIVALCVVLNGLDGFDVLSVSFASPGIAAEWGIDRAALGVVLSMELIGMALGSLALGQLADRIGSRATALLCLAIMALGMFLAAQSSNPFELSLIRLTTGIGIGGLLASISALAAGSANNSRKPTAVALVAAGYPLGAVIGGTLSSQLLIGGDWRDVFLLGAGLTAVMLPVAWWILPESFESILRRHKESNRLTEVNRSLTKLGHVPLDRLATAPQEKKPSFVALFSPTLRSGTLLLVAAYFLHMVSFYFLLKWTPKIVADLGFSPSDAATVLVWFNIGGLLGSFLISFLTTRLPLLTLLMATLLLSPICISWFGFSVAEIGMLSFAACAAGFSANAAIVGLYALIAAFYPAHLRAGGIGLVIGLGRGGSALGPILGGALFSLGLERNSVATILGCGSLMAVLAIALFHRRQKMRPDRS